MGLIYRHQKNEPLTIAEMDGNFAHLEARIKALETKPPLAEGIAGIHQERDQITVEGTFGTILGRFILPKVFPNPRGRWEPDTAYSVYDWVYAEGGLYSCLSPHTSQNFQDDQEKWALVFAVGS